MTRPRIWLLLGHRRGDNNQLLALGEALGEPFETRTMSDTWLARFRMRYFLSDIGHLKQGSRQWLTPTWPDLRTRLGILIKG